MADITMCLDKDCKKKDTCYRYIAPRDKYYQAYFLDTPRKKDKCKYYWEVNKDGTTVQ